MTTSKELARRKLAAAEKASTTVLAGIEKATTKLGAGIRYNGFGIISDPQSVRYQLLDAQALIQESLALLAAVDWPTDAEYDCF